GGAWAAARRLPLAPGGVTRAGPDPDGAEPRSLPCRGRGAARALGAVDRRRSGPHEQEGQGGAEERQDELGAVRQKEAPPDVDEEDRDEQRQAKQERRPAGRAA